MTVCSYSEAEQLHQYQYIILQDVNKRIFPRGRRPSADRFLGSVCLQLAHVLLRNQHHKPFLLL